MENQGTAVQPETTPATVNVSPDPKAFPRFCAQKESLRPNP